MPNTPEQFEKRDTLEAELVEALRTRPDALDTKQLFVKWCEREESIADQDPTGRLRIELDRKRARLYIEMGDIGGALDILWEAAERAANEEFEDLKTEIRAEYDELDLKIAERTADEKFEDSEKRKLEI